MIIEADKYYTGWDGARRYVSVVGPRPDYDQDMVLYQEVDADGNLDGRYVCTPTEMSAWAKTEYDPTYVSQHRKDAEHVLCELIGKSAFLVGFEYEHDQVRDFVAHVVNAAKDELRKELGR